MEFIRKHIQVKIMGLNYENEHRNIKHASKQYWAEWEDAHASFFVLVVVFYFIVRIYHFFEWIRSAAQKKEWECEKKR
jgi:hypothetical protein